MGKNSACLKKNQTISKWNHHLVFNTFSKTCYRSYQYTWYQMELPHADEAMVWQKLNCTSKSLTIPGLFSRRPRTLCSRRYQKRRLSIFLSYRFTLPTNILASSTLTFKRSLFTGLPSLHFLVQSKQLNIAAMCEICSKFTIKNPEWRHWSNSGVFIVNFEQISHITLVFHC